MVDGMVARIKAKGGVVATVAGAGKDGVRDDAPGGRVEANPLDRPAMGKEPVRGDAGITATGEGVATIPTRAGPAPARDILAGGSAAPVTGEIPAGAGPRLEDEEEARVAAAAVAGAAEAAKAAAEKAKRRRQAVLSRRGRGGRGL